MPPSKIQVSTSPPPAVSLPLPVILCPSSISPSLNIIDLPSFIASAPSSPPNTSPPPPSPTPLRRSNRSHNPPVKLQDYVCSQVMHACSDQPPSSFPSPHKELTSDMEFLTSKPGTQKRIAVVTGANKGIGFEIVRQLANNGIMVLLTARDETRGTEAAEKLISSGVSDVVFHQLDVSDPASVLSVAQFIKTEFGKIDILVNNAAVSGIELEPEAMDLLKQEDGIENKMKYFNSAKQTFEMAKECLNINYYGTKRVTETLIPLLQLSLSPKIVNVSSLYGQLNFIPNKSIQKELSEVDDQTEEKIDQMLQKFLNDMKENKLEENQWPTQVAAYKVSKVAINTYTRIIARKLNTFSINCVNPGFVKTDMNWNSGISTTEEGASCAVMLALLPHGSPSGFFYDNNMEVISFQ